MQKQPDQWIMINDWIENINDCFFSVHKLINKSSMYIKYKYREEE